MDRTIGDSTSARGISRSRGIGGSYAKWLVNRPDRALSGPMVCNRERYRVRSKRRRSPMTEPIGSKVRGLNHLALVCSDMARTVDFYTNVLGFPLVKTVDLPGGRGQHFFFDI